MATNIDNAVLNFSFTVAEVNGLLNILGNTAYVQSAALINKIQEQGTPQFAKIQAEADAADAVAEAIATDAPVAVAEAIATDAPVAEVAPV